jgi:hypothetical protein
MNTIAILPESGEENAASFRAISTNHKATGRTPGEALDALTSQLGAEKTGAAVILQPFLPDRHFPAEQRERLSALMARWRDARDAGRTLPAAEQAELETLVEAELQGSAERATQVSHDLEASQRTHLRRLDERGAVLRELRENERRRVSLFNKASGLLSASNMIVLVTVLIILLREGVIAAVGGTTIFIIATVLISLFLNLCVIVMFKLTEWRHYRAQLKALKGVADELQLHDGGEKREQTIAR